MNKIITIIVIILIAVLGVYFVFTNNQVTEVQKNNNTVATKQNETAPTESNNVEEKTKVENGGSDVVSPGSYENYSSGKIVLAKNNKVVLYFHAPWCPSCRIVNADIENNLGNIPSGFVILKTDYDTETELKKKYGVTYQHTFVQVDENGNMIKKWSGGPTLSSIISQVK